MPAWDAPPPPSSFRHWGIREVNILPTERHGLYDPAFEHDACGVGFIADLNGNKTHEIVSKGLEILVNLEHRGASGAEKNTGDGAGILVQMPHSFFLKVTSSIGIALPVPGTYGVGMVYLPKEPKARKKIQGVVERCVSECGQSVIGWREVPTDASSLGPTAISAEPSIWQVFVRRAPDLADAEAFERKLFVHPQIRRAHRASKPGVRGRGRLLRLLDVVQDHPVQGHAHASAGSRPTSWTLPTTPSNRPSP